MQLYLKNGHMLFVCPRLHKVKPMSLKNQNQRLKHAAFKICFLLIAFSFNKAYSQKVNFEQYYFSGDKQQHTSPTIVSYRAAHNWYNEARFNYEDFNTASLYTGRSFSHNGNISYEAIPLAGAVFGRFNGGSLGLNINISSKKIFLSSQAQYTFSVQNKNLNYFYNWSELTLETTDWLYAGIVSQQTIISNNLPGIENGVVIGFSLKKFTFPVYIFTPQKEKAFIMFGLNWEWNHTN